MNNKKLLIKIAEFLREGGNDIYLMLKSSYRKRMIIVAIIFITSRSDRSFDSM